MPEGGEEGDENEEEQRRGAASRQVGQPAPGGVFPSGTVFDPSEFQGMQVKATETSLFHQEKEREKEADIFAGKDAWIRAYSELLSIPFKQQQQQLPHGYGLP